MVLVELINGFTCAKLFWFKKIYIVDKNILNLKLQKKLLRTLKYIM